MLHLSVRSCHKLDSRDSPSIIHPDFKPKIQYFCGDVVKLKHAHVFLFVCPHVWSGLNRNWFKWQWGGGVIPHCLNCPVSCSNAWMNLPTFSVEPRWRSSKLTKGAGAKQKLKDRFSIFGLYVLLGGVRSFHFRCFRQPQPLEPRVSQNSSLMNTSQYNNPLNFGSLW